MSTAESQLMLHVTMDMNLQAKLCH